VLAGFVNSLTKPGVFGFIDVVRTGEADPKKSVFPTLLGSPGNIPTFKSLKSVGFPSPE
jgi:hypothetical protein